MLSILQGQIVPRLSGFGKRSIGTSRYVAIGNVIFISGSFVTMNQDIFLTESRIITNLKTFSRLQSKLYYDCIEMTPSLCTFTYYWKSTQECLSMSDT